MKKLTTVATVLASVLAVSAFAGEADARGYRAKTYGWQSGKYMLTPSELRVCVGLYNAEAQRRANLTRMKAGPVAAYNAEVDRANEGIEAWNSKCANNYYYTSDLPAGQRIDELQGQPDPMDDEVRR